MTVSIAPSGFALVSAPGGPGLLPHWRATPNAVDPAAPAIVAVHGILRNAREQAELLGPLAARFGRVVIAPLFDRTDWPRYQQAVVKGRADQALLALWDHLVREGHVSGSSFELAGFSGGGQFAHRFALLHPARVLRLTVSSAGWYTFPDAAAFPYGFGPPERGTRDWGAACAEGLVDVLQRPVHVCVGEFDDAPDPATRSGPAINAQQGRDRRTRAERWAVAMTQAARARGLEPLVRLAILPRCRHHFRGCVRDGGLDRIIVTGEGGLAVG